MNEKEIIELLTDKYAIAAVVTVILFYFTIRGQKRSNNLFIHLARVCAACALVLATSLCARELVSKFGFTAVNPYYVDVFQRVAIVLILLREAFLGINRFCAHLGKTSGDPTLGRMVARLLKAGICLCAMLLFGEYLGISFAGLLTFGGIGGIAIGLACKNILGNFFSGLMLYFDRPFDIGDWVKSPDRKVEGTVVEIGWRMCNIMTFEHYPLYVPNEVFSSICIENVGRISSYRIKLLVGLRYEDADRVQAVTEGIEKMLQEEDGVDKGQTLLVCFNEFADSSLNIMVYCYARTANWERYMLIQHRVYLKIIKVVHGLGADFAFPTRTLYLEKDDAPPAQNAAVQS
ncbi:MAG: mechanosensitive ion channel family protein [Desulfovibrio sp.]|nr:mechanosensitive ion channel family protein [Desulfovibrio sp.]